MAGWQNRRERAISVRICCLIALLLCEKSLHSLVPPTPDSVAPLPQVSYWAARDSRGARYFFASAGLPQARYRSARYLAVSSM